VLRSKFGCWWAFRKF